VLCATAAIALPAQTFTSLFAFSGRNGANPYGGLVQGTDGNFDGTTAFGGSGTVFKITPSGTLTTLYSFCSQTNCTDGGTPTPGSSNYSSPGRSYFRFSGESTLYLKDGRASRSLNLSFSPPWAARLLLQRRLS
jgi:uncharacterized repeat protein (TIGR03803 family)